MTVVNQTAKDTRICPRHAGPVSRKPDYLGLADRLESCRAELGKTTRQMSDVTGLEGTHYQLLVDRLRRVKNPQPSFHVLSAVLQYLQSIGYSTSWLLYGDGPRHAAPSASSPEAEAAGALQRDGMAPETATELVARFSSPGATSLSIYLAVRAYLMTRPNAAQASRVAG